MTVREQFPKEPTAPAAARRLLDCLDGRLPAERIHDARLLVSEVVTNAVEHVDAEGEIEVRIDLVGPRLHVEVLDPGHGFVVPQRDPAAHRGWGLQFVARLADRWGVGDGARGRVWFELAA